MSGLFRLLGRALGFSKSQQSLNSTQGLPVRDLTKFAEGDRVLIDGARLTAPLRKDSNYNFQHGILLNNDIIGKQRSTLYMNGKSASGKNALYKIEPPTLDQYVSLTPRLVTPVYASYASTIVSLLDIHPVPWTQSQSTESTSSPGLEILEAGTGHGSLTLHIAREIAAANPPPLTINVPQIQKENSSRAVKSTKPQIDQDLDRAWNDWKATRKAILHTVEKVEANRWHAEKVVRGFRQGLYWPHVDFYIGDVRKWVDDQLKRRHEGSWTGSSSSKPTEGFLDYVLLDMPGVETQLKHVHAAMREGAKLIVFAPSVTQIGQCIRIIQEASLPLRLEKVLELGEGISNGRQWDVRMVRPRRHDDSPSQKPTSPSPAAEPTEVEPQAVTPASEEITISSEGDAADERELPVQEESTDEPVMICRPLVGERTIGGGFIGLFKKMSPESVAVEAQWRRNQTGWSSKKRHRLAI